MNDNHALTRRGPDNKPWYVVASTAGMLEAEIIAGLLRSANIPLFLFREASSTAIPLSFGLIGGVDVLVPEDYYEEASALLETHEGRILNELPPDTDDPDEEL